MKGTVVYLLSELKEGKAFLTINRKEYIYDDYDISPTYQFDDDGEDEYILSRIDLVDDKVGEYCSVEIDEDGFVSELYYNSNEYRDLELIAEEMTERIRIIDDCN